MIKVCFLLLFTTFAASGFGQFFEGKITYNIACKSNMEGISNEQMCDGSPAKQEYFIKNGNYKFTFPGATEEWMIYVKDARQIMKKMVDSDTLYWIDATKNDDTIVSVKINKQVTEVLGYTCDEIIFTLSNGFHKFYFSKQFSVDKTLFTKHQYGSLFEFFKRSNSLVLKEVLEDNYLTVMSIATEIKPMKVDDAIFELPVSPTILKAP